MENIKIPFDLEIGDTIFHKYLGYVEITNIQYNETNNPVAFTLHSNKKDLEYFHPISDFGKILFFSEEHLKFSFNDHIDYFSYSTEEEEKRVKEEQRLLEEKEKEKERIRNEIINKDRKKAKEILDQRKNAYDLIIYKINKADPDFNFEGLIHACSMKNFIGIINDGFLYPRNDHKYIQDDANHEVLNVTDTDAFNCTRFYYREGTPTHYRAKYDHPVILVFDPLLMLDSQAKFGPISAGTTNGLHSKDIFEAISFDWDAIITRGKYDYMKTNYYKPRRNCDFHYAEKVPTKKIIKIYFNSQKDFDYANENIKTLGNYNIEINPKKFENFKKSSF